MNNETPSVVLGMYTGRSVAGSMPLNALGFAWELSAAGMWGGPSRVGGSQWVTSCRVDSNRNYLIQDFLDSGVGTHLFIFDEDMIHAPSTPVVLAQRNLPIVCGLYFHRGTEKLYVPHFYRYLGQSPDERRGHGTSINDYYVPMSGEVGSFFSGLQRPIPYVNSPLILAKADGTPITSGLMRIDASGFGCAMLSREALEKLEPPYLRDQPGLNGDFTFYKQCREKGIEVWGDCGVIASHMDTNAFIGIAAFSDYVTSTVEQAQKEKGNVV